MSVRLKIFSIVAFCGFLFFSTITRAGVCFIVGDCGRNNEWTIYNRCSTESNGYYFSSCPEGYKLAGQRCYSREGSKYQRCECDIGYFSILYKENDEKYEYRNLANQSSSDSNYCENTRAHEKYCKSIYKYASSKDIAESWAAPQSKPIVCPNDMVVDEESDSCVELYGIKEGFRSYRKYSACKCPDLPSNGEWKDCNEEHQVGAGEVCNGKYTACTCENGYHMYEGACYKDPLGDDNDPTVEPRNLICKFPQDNPDIKVSDIQYTDKNPQESALNGKNWVLFYANGANESIIYQMAEKLKKGDSKISKIDLVFHFVEESEIVDYVLARGSWLGKEIKKVYEINLHPLFSTMMYTGDADWGFDLGIAEKPITYKSYNNPWPEGETYDIPLLMYGILHTADAYNGYCDGEDTEDEENAIPYGYYGWLGSLTSYDAWKQIRGQFVAAGTKKQRVSSTPMNEPAMHTRPFVRAKSCHPGENGFAGKNFGCQGNGCKKCPMKNNSESEVFKWGGDKCLSVVFAMDKESLKMPAMVFDTDNGVAYVINSEPRYYVGYDYVTWKAEDVRDGASVYNGANTFRDFAGNFIPAKIIKSESCEYHCYDKKSYYNENNIDFYDINTYHNTNAWWLKNVFSGKKDKSEGKNVLAEQPDIDTNSLYVDTFVGGDAMEYAMYRHYDWQNGSSGQYPKDWYKRKYYNNNSENAVNGIYGISNPYCGFRDEGEGASSEYKIK